MGKLAQPVPVMVARSLELFAKSLLLAAGRVAEQAGAKTLSPVHLKTAVEEDERMDFLKSKVCKGFHLTDSEINCFKQLSRWKTCPGQEVRHLLAKTKE